MTEDQTGQGMPAALQSPAEAPVPRWVRTWLMTLSVTVGVLVLLVVGSVMVGLVTWWGSYSLIGGYGDSFADTESVATEIELLLQDGDVDGYMDLYRAEDDSYDVDKVRADFVKTVESLDESATTIDYSVEQATLYEDETSGEKVARMTLSAYDWNTGNPVGRPMTVWAVYEELPNVVLTGKEGRELGNAEMLW